MEKKASTLTEQFAALSHPQRLAVFRLLVRRCPDALPAGEIAEVLGHKASTLSVYLAALTRVGLISQTRDSAMSVDQFIGTLESRVHALARAHDQLTAERWDPASLKSLITCEFDAYAQPGARRLRIDGPDALIGPNAYTALALVLHEMTTNSVKYGALCDNSGSVRITLSEDRGGALEIRWVERGGPPVSPPRRRGFGTTIIETSTRKKLAGEEVAIGDVCFKRGGVFAMELGGPEVGRGCGGRGIIHGFELLEKLGFHDWDFDYVLLDFLGDVVCGGFGLPIARDMAQKVILVASNDLQSLYVANNVCSAVEYFRKLGGNVGVAGLVVNKDDHSGEAQAFAKAVDIPVLCAIPANEEIRRKSANYQIIGKPGGEWAPLFEELAINVANAPPQRPTPLEGDGLLDLFSPEDTGGNVQLIPATQADMRGGSFEPKPSLEVVYDEV